MPARGVRKMVLRPRDQDFIVEEEETIRDGDREISLFYFITTRDNKTIEVFPETLEEMKKLERLPDPQQLVKEIEERINLRDNKPKVLLKFSIDHYVETYKLNVSVIIRNYITTATEKEGKIPQQLRTQLKYALKIMELYREIDDLFELLELSRMSEEQEED